MRLFNRISATVLSSVDGVISKVENHEAVVDSMITDIQKSAGKARVQLKRVQKDRKVCEKQITELKSSADLWQTRALEAANQDGDKNIGEERALECLQRRKQCLQRIETLSQSLKGQVSQETHLVSNQKKIEERLQEVKQQRNLMRSRESVSGAMRTLKSIEGDGCGQLDDALDRWEISMATMDVESADIAFGEFDVDDPLDEQYRTQEEKQNLRSELAMLKMMNANNQSKETGRAKSDDSDSEGNNHV